MSDGHESDEGSSGSTHPQQVTDRSRVLVPIRLHPDTKERVTYWAARRQRSANQYIADAIAEKIARENQDYDLPTLEAKRLAQLTDLIQAVSSNVANLEQVTITGFDSLLRLTRGDNYLLDESGEGGQE